MTPETQDWLDQPALARLWDQLKDRLERNGLEVRGRLRIEGVGDAEREALSLLMGRVYSGTTVSFLLAELDEQLRSGAAEIGLIGSVEALRGRLTSRPAAKDARRTAKESLWATASDALRTHGLDQWQWARSWLEEIRRGGTLGRLHPDRAVRLIAQAVGVLAILDVTDSPDEAGSTTHGRGELAERVTGTAHGLDDDTLLARLVLRALARAGGQDPPAGARARRELWESYGIATDRVSGTVLTYGLTPLGDEWPARMLRDRSAASAETHLTMRDLRRTRWRLVPETLVFVCENPRVVEAAADAGCAAPLVCTSGNPTTVVLDLLDALVGAGAELAYRGDFDWPGVAMANRIISRYGARPWRMRAIDYEQHVAMARDRGTPLQPLTGAQVVASWDPELTEAMAAIGVAVHEESALNVLLSDLQG